jgi:hypothetical protein
MCVARGVICSRARLERLIGAFNEIWRLSSGHRGWPFIPGPLRPLSCALKRRWLACTVGATNRATSGRPCGGVFYRDTAPMLRGNLAVIQSLTAAADVVDHWFCNEMVENWVVGRILREDLGVI